MGNSRNTGFINNIVKYDANGNVNIVSGSTTLLYISSSGAITTTGVISGSNALSASYAQTASFVNLAQTASFVANAQTASFVANAQSASNAVSAITASSADNLLVRNTLTAQTIVVQTITSSVDFVTGSTKFGSISSNTHQFTGSMSVSGSGTFVGNIIAGDVIRVSGSGAYFTISDTQASSKNWAIRAGHDAVGDLAIRQSNSTGGDPVAAGTTRLYINASGNVGIGVIPSAWYTGYTALQVGESAALFSNRTSADTRTTQLANNAYLNSGATNWIYAQTDEATRYEQVNGEHKFYTAASGTAGNNITWTTPLTITSGGNVGIGTTSPITRLQVIANTPTYLYSPGQLDVRTQESQAANRGAMISIGGNATGNNTPYNFGIIGAYKTNSTVDDFSSYMIFGTSDVYSNVFERMRITTSGNLGIGTTNPHVKLHVGNGSQTGINGADNKIHIATTGTRSALLTLANSSGAVTVEGQFESSAETADLRVIIGSTSNHPVVFRANNVEAMRITSGGQMLFSRTTTSSTDCINIETYSGFSGRGILLNMDAGNDAITIGGSGTQNAINVTNSSKKVIISNLGGSGTVTVQADNSGTLVKSSDSSLKQEDKDYKIQGLAEILQLQPRAYKWLKDIEVRKEQAVTEIGFFADEVNPIIPSAAPKGFDGLYWFNDRAVTAALVKAIQEQQAQINELKAQING